MNRRILFGAALAAALLLGIPNPARAGDIPEVPDPTCAGCGAVGSGGSITHNEGCPYGPGGGSGSSGPSWEGGESQGGDPEKQADAMLSILLFPVSAASGMVFGGIWHVRRLGGGFSDKGCVESWSDYITDHYPLKTKGASGGFWGRLGGAPFLALYPVSFGVKQAGLGLVWCAGRMAAPFKEGPPAPSRNQYRMIADEYARLRDESEKTRARMETNALAVQARMDRYLDELIEGRETLRSVLANEGREAARARARKTLDAWVKAYRGKRAIIEVNLPAIAELERLRGGAMEKAIEVNRDYVLRDRPLEQAEAAWEKALASGNLTEAESKRVGSSLKNLKRISAAKTAKDLGEHALWLRDNLKKRIADAEAENQGKSRAILAWAADREVRERLGRMGLIALDRSGLAETGLDASYGITAELLLAGKIDDLKRQCEAIQTVRWSQDVQARDWIRLENEQEAWKRQEEHARKLRDRYEGEAKANADKA